MAPRAKSRGPRTPGRIGTVTTVIPATRSGLGRPVATSREEIEAVAFALFDEHGFADTTVDAIASAAGIGRRTLFRYFESKNDIPWGRFDEGLAEFRRILAASPPELPLHESVHRAVLTFNDFGTEAAGQHRRRMSLILSTPALQAHSALRYEQWRQCIVDHVAERTDAEPSDLLPVTVGHVSLALAMSAYEYWLTHEGTDLLDALDDAMGSLRSYLT